jgi:hypothetical protein
MAKILIVLPYSGRGFGGGLAVFNADITKAFAEKHDVRLLTMGFGDPRVQPLQADHGNAKLLYIKNSDVAAMQVQGAGIGESDRNKLYDLFNDDELLLRDNIKQLIEGGEKWTPQVIVGHSRFSGPAAISIRDTWYKDAKALYFMHSFPVEGSVLSGYEAYEESSSAAVAKKKFDTEKMWMPKADLVVAVGPLIRNGVQLILGQDKIVPIHECIGGVKVADTPVPFDQLAYQKAGVTNFLFLGRANAPIKGLDDIIMAAVALRTLPITITIRYWSDNTYLSGPVTKDDVQAYVNGALNTKDPACKIRVTIAGKTEDPAAEVRKYHGLLMPSYIEHFGLVPFDALGEGVPVLVNEISGIGMFLADTARFGHFGPPCVVEDFTAPQRPLQPADYLQNVAKTAFDNRPVAWADAIRKYMQEVPERFVGALTIYNVLKGYSWADCAQGVMAAVAKQTSGKKPIVTVQRENGDIAEL